MRPTGVVRGVTKILHAISSELCLLTRGDIAHPKVVIANESSTLFVRRHQRIHRAATSAETLTGGLGGPFGNALARSQIAFPASSLGSKRNGLAVRRELKIHERK